MNKSPEISILVPVYKAEKYLPDCLESILAQSFSDFELVLIDDGSPDQSGNICDAYALRDNRIRVIHKANGGASTARKAGVEASRGNYIGWVDADDRIDKEMFTVLHNLAKSHNADIVECQYIMFKNGKQIRSGMDEPIVSGDGDFILKQFFSAKMKPSFCNKLYRSEVFDKIQFPNRQIHVDLYVNMRLALMPLTYVRTSEALYYYIMRKNSNITTYNARAIREALYKYDYTMKLAAENDANKLAKKYLSRDSINRLMGRYFEVSVNSDLKNQNVYNYYIRRMLGSSLIKYLILSGLPLKTRISYLLLLCNFKRIQVSLHNRLGEK